MRRDCYSEQTRQVWEMRRAGLSVSVISERLGIPHNTAKKAVARGIKSGNVERLYKKHKRRTLEGTCRSYGITRGNIGTAIEDAVTIKQREWMFEQARQGGFETIADWLVDYASQQYFEEIKNDAQSSIK